MNLIQAHSAPSNPIQSIGSDSIRFDSSSLSIPISLSFRVEISSAVDSVDNIVYFRKRTEVVFSVIDESAKRPAPMILARGHRGRCKAPEPESRRVDLTNKIGWFFQQKYWYNGDLRSKIMQRDIE